MQLKLVHYRAIAILTIYDSIHPEFFFCACSLLRCCTICRYEPFLHVSFHHPLPHVTGHCYCGHFLLVPICLFIVFELNEGHTVADMNRSPLNLTLYVCVTVFLPCFLNDWKPGQIHVRSELKR